MEEVLQFLGNIRPLTQACTDDLIRLVKHKKFPKKQKILDFGQMNRELLFITKGTFYGYSLVDGKVVPRWFFWELEMVVSIGAFYDRKPSKECIVPLTNAEAYYITRDAYEYLCRTYGEFADIARLLLQKYFVIIDAHAWVIQNHTHEERYQWLLDNRPELLRRVPLYLIAPWLKMSREHLSRIRRNRR